MTDPEQIPHLLKLLDDESVTVREAVAEALAAFGPSLEQQLARLPNPPDAVQRRQIQDLLRDHRRGDLSSPVSVQTDPLFEVGWIVRQRRYGYRGVVVAFDLTCQAEDGWYFANRTQPERYQPWYHLLVHDGPHVTYAAQTSLDREAWTLWRIRICAPFPN